MILTPLTLNGESLQLTPEGALFRPACRTLLVADLHFEKGSAMAARSRRLAPPYDTQATLERLTRVMRRTQPKRVIALGDSFHDVDGPNRLPAVARSRITALTQAVEWVWVEGNHDPAPPSDLGGAGAPDLTIGNLILRHAPKSGPAPGEIAGHLHPKAAVSTSARRVSGFCFVTDGSRLVMPAFGAYTGGLDVNSPPFRVIFRKGFRVFMLGRERLYAIPRSRLSRPRGETAA
jgi:DNA ligase-associated metallophosphoesterase